MDELKKYIKEKNKTHLIFDFDETIATFLLPWSEWFKDVGDAVIKREPQLKGKSYWQLHNDYIKKHGQKALNHIRKLNEEFETKKLQGLDANSELVNFIASNPQYTYYIWSSNSKKAVREALKKLKILKNFEKIITRADSTYIKPDPDGFSLIDEGNVPKDKYLFIGDSQADQKAAKAIGIDFFKVT